jgi:P-type conjugative transfer protein TrbJ
VITKRLSRALAMAVLVLLPMVRASQAHAQWIVHDPGNAVLLVEQLAHQAQEIDNQVQQIQNQIQSLQNQEKMLAHLNFTTAGQAIESMQQIQQTLRTFCVELQTEGISDPIGFDAGYNCGLVAQELRSVYPASGDWPGQSDQQIAGYPSQWATEKSAAAAKAVQTQDASVANMDPTQARMSELASASQSAPGQTSAIQVTNEMLVTLSGQLRDQQSAELATQRSLALQQSEEAAEYARNQELVARATRDADTTYDVTPVSDPFSGD